VKRSRRERKISKVMGEFKDGTLKSGGSGRKVTNPKQAMAIALSEANRMNQGGIVGLAQMQSPFANSIRPKFQDMGPRPIAPGPQQMGPMQRNFSQIQGQGRQPLDAYKGYLQSTYILPMQQNEVQKVNQFVNAVGQAEKQLFGRQQGGKTFGGRLQPGMPGSGLVEQGRGQPMGPLQPREPTLTNSVLRPNQAPDVMPPMNMAPAVMPDGYSDRAANFDLAPINRAQLGSAPGQGPGVVLQGGPVFMNQGGMMYSDIMNRPMFQTPQQRQGMGIMAGVAPVRGYKDGGEAEEIAVTAESPEELDIKLFGEGGVLFDTDSPISSTLMALTIPLGGGAIALTARGLMAARKAAQVAQAAKRGSKVDDAVDVAISPGSSYRVGAGQQIAAKAPTPPPPPSIAARAAGIPAAAAGAIRRNPGKTAIAGIAAGGASTIPFGGEEQTTEPPVETPAADTGGGDDTGDQQSGIMKFLFGADGIGGEPGAVGKTLDYLADPKTRYALARAAESRPGVVDRNFFTDFTLGQAEYEAAQQQNQTAFMRNFEALREIYPDDVSDEEIAKLALGDSDDPRETFLTLFGKRLEGMTAPTPAEIEGLAVLAGYDLSEEELEQIVAMQAKPEATLS